MMVASMYHQYARYFRIFSDAHASTTVTDDMIRIAVFIVPTGTFSRPCGHMPGGASIRKKMYAEKSPPKSITSDARKSQIPILAFQRPVSGRVEIVYGISMIQQITDSLHVNKLCGRFAARSLSGFHRLILHREVAFATWQAVFVRAAICNRRGDEISVRWRRRRSPFQRRRFPWIVVHFFAVFDAPKEIDNEWNLSEAHDPRCPGDRLVPFEAGQSPDRMIIRHVPSLPAVIPAPMHPGHALQEHRKKDRVHADQRRPEMHFAPEVAHLSASRFGEPVINAGEKSEDCARRHDVMEMRDDVVSVVQIKVG